MISKISADKGVLFDFTNSQKLKESGFALQGKTVNGYVASNGDITVNVNSAKALNSVVGHEIAHVLEGTELYKALQESITEYAKTKGEYQTRYNEIAKLYEGVKGANIENELTSELVGDYLFTDSDFISKLSTENRNVFQKIYDEIKYLCKVATAGSKEARQLEKVKKAFEKAYRETTAEKNNTAEGGVRYSLSANARNDVRKALYDKNFPGEVKLTDSSPSVLLSQKGVKNLPMVMNASHIRENIFTEEEARNNGLKVNPNINYHGLGEDLFLKVIDELDDVTEAYRGTKNAEKVERRENYFLLISRHTDADGNVINVPVYINEKGLYNKVFIDTNKISTVFGRIELRKYINRQLEKGNLIRIKKRSNQTSESTSPINADYEVTTSLNSISDSSENVKQKQLEIIEKVNPAPNTYNTWIRKVEDIKTLAETLEDSDWADGDEFNPDLTRKMIEEAIESGEITVFSSYPIEQGVFVSPSYMEAASYSGDGNVYEKTVSIDDVAWIDPTQGMYANTTENQNVQFSLSDNIENAEKTLYNKNSPLAIVDRAKTNNSSSLNWVYKSEIFSVNENKLFHEKISEINQGSQAFSKNSLGEYMIPIENKIVFTDGNYDSPYVREIVEVLTEYQTEFEDIRERIFNVEKGKSEKQDASRYVNLTYGKGRIVTYASGIGGVYGWEDGRRKGKTRGAVIRNYLNKQYRGRNDRTSKEAQINEIVPIKETSSTDGVFSLFSKDTAPKKYGDYNVYGEDITLQTKEDIAPVRDDVQKDLLSTNAKSFGITKPNDYVHVQRQVFETLLNEGFFSNKQNRNRTDVNEETGMIIETNKSGIYETFSLENYGSSGKEKKAVKLATVRKLPEIIQKGKLISNDINNYHKDDSSVKFAYIESVVEVDGQNISVKIDIKKSPQKNKFWVHRIETLEKANGFPADTSRVLKQGIDHISSTESISNNDMNVNSDDIAPVREDIAPIKTVEDRITAKIKNYQEERSNNIRLCEKSNAEFDIRIAEAQAEYDAKKNKDTKAANNILRHIETLKRRKNNIDAEIDILKKHPITIRCFLH